MISAYKIRWPITSCLGALSDEYDGIIALRTIVAELDTIYIRNNINDILLSAIISNVIIKYEIDQVYYENDLPCLSGKSTIKIITLRELSTEEEFKVKNFFANYIIEKHSNWLVIFESDFSIEKIDEYL